MTIHVSWYNEEETILIIEYKGQWTLDEFYRMLQETTRMTENGKPFVVIGDFSHSSMIPNGVLSTGRRLDQTTPPHRLMLILIQPNMLMQMLVKAISNIYPKVFDNAHIVTSMDDALAAAHAKLKV